MGPSVTIGGQGVSNRGTGSGSTNIPSTSNVFGPYYYSPYQYGIITSGTSLPSATSLQSNFGQPLYGTATTNTTGATGTGQTATTQGAGFTTLGRSRAPAYYTALSPDFVMPQYAPGKLQSQLQRVLERTIGQRGQNIRVQVVDGARVILRGQVESPRDFERAEAQVRITPGVDDVQNQLTITGSAQSGTGPIQRASN